MECSPLRCPFLITTSHKHIETASIPPPAFARRLPQMPESVEVLTSVLASLADPHWEHAWVPWLPWRLNPKRNSGDLGNVMQYIMFASKFRYGSSRGDPDACSGLDHLACWCAWGYGLACGFRAWIRLYILTRSLLSLRTP